MSQKKDNGKYSYNRQLPPFLAKMMAQAGYQDKEQELQNKFDLEASAGKDRVDPTDKDDAPTIVVLDDTKQFSTEEVADLITSSESIVTVLARDRKIQEATDRIVGKGAASRSSDETHGRQNSKPMFRKKVTVTKDSTSLTSGSTVTNGDNGKRKIDSQNSRKAGVKNAKLLSFDDDDT